MSNTIRQRAPWMINPPTGIKEKLALIKRKKSLLRSQGPKGRFLRNLLKSIQGVFDQGMQKAKEQEPLAFFKPSYEQALLLNSWMFGIAFICVYSANRIGKTTACIVNMLLWIIPNNPRWMIFKPYTDHLGRYVKVYERPTIHSIKWINKALKQRPLDLPAPDPTKAPTETDNNQAILQWLQKVVPKAFKRSWPISPWNNGGTIWTGAPDQDHHEDTIMPLWKQYIPSRFLDRYVPSSREITLKITSPSGHMTCWEWIGKSYESKDTKWSSGAVDAIVLTEGVDKATLKEIKMRFKDPGIGSHDFTPYEAANSGAASALAQRIKNGTEKLPVPYFVWTKFRVYDAPTHIISEDKRQGLIESYAGDPEGKARLDGDFYTSSMLVLSNLNRNLQLLQNITIPEMFERWPNGRIHRGFDPGLDHPAACTWGYLLPTHQLIIYRMWAEQGLTISQRCKKIIKLSNNSQGKVYWGKGKEDFYLTEIHNKENSEIVQATHMDYHAFKRDEVSGLNYALNYQLQGLNVVESVHTKPEDRASELNDKLVPSKFLPSVLTDTPPGFAVNFLGEGPGVLAFFAEMEEFYWDRKRSGEDKGQPKDKVPVHDDDKLDATCYITSKPLRWTSYSVPARVIGDSEPEDDLIQAAQHIRRTSVRGRTFATVAKGKKEREKVVFGDIEELNEEVGFDVTRY